MATLDRLSVDPTVVRPNLASHLGLVGFEPGAYGNGVGRRGSFDVANRGRQELQLLAGVFLQGVELAFMPGQTPAV